MLHHHAGLQGSLQSLLSEVIVVPAKGGEHALQPTSTSRTTKMVLCHACHRREAVCIHLPPRQRLEVPSGRPSSSIVHGVKVHLQLVLLRRSYLVHVILVLGVICKLGLPAAPNAHYSNTRPGIRYSNSAR